MTPLFRAKAPKIMRDLMRDFSLDAESAAAILGNLGHETGGFKHMQELKPIVAGSRGGYGWAQWTGARRREFEGWAAARSLPIDSDAANYGFLCHELRTSEAKAIPAVKRAVGLRDKVTAFELAYERAGAKHYGSRIRYADAALKAYRGPVPAPKTTGGVAAGTAAGAAAKAAGFSWLPVIGFALFAAVVVAIVIHYLKRDRK